MRNPSGGLRKAVHKEWGRQNRQDEARDRGFRRFAKAEVIQDQIESNEEDVPSTGVRAW